MMFSIKKFQVGFSIFGPYLLQFPIQEIGNGINIIIRSNKELNEPAKVVSTGTDPPVPFPRRGLGFFFKGWRFGVSIGALTATLVFVTNFTVTIWLLAHYEFKDGLTTAYEGNCSKARTLSQWLHLGINVLSTLLLGASNYCMQCLSSPTRNEVDVAHADNRSLKIGVPSIKNLGRISRTRVILWICLALSSFPLHLLWNAAVVEVISANDYLALLVTERFILGGSWSNGQAKWTHKFTNEIQAMQDNISGLEKLDNAACIRAYGSRFVSDRRHVLIVSNAVDTSNELIRYFNAQPERSSYYTFSWLCPPSINNRTGLYEDCDPKAFVKQANDWQLSGFNATYGSFYDGGPVSGQVQYCLSQQTPARCEVKISIQILIAVSICNLVKIVCLLATLWTVKDSLLVTTGDTIASFLNVPDTTTKDRCIINQHNLGWRGQGWAISSDFVIKRWKPQPTSWFQADDGARWLACIAPVFVLIISTSWFLGSSVVGAGGFGKDRFGHADPSSAAQSQVHEELMLTVVLVNLPQLVVSYIYVVYNGLFTCMLLSAEWSRYAHHRKGLRVTSPVGQQRSTYYLQLPYAYAVPLLLMSGLIHWLISQSLFLVRVTIYDFEGVKSRTISAYGSSPLAMVLTASMGGLLVITALLLGLIRKYKPGMPSAAINSAAISLACHPVEDSLDVATLPVMFGVVETADGVRRATFSSKEVTLLAPRENILLSASRG